MMQIRIRTRVTLVWVVEAFWEGAGYSVGVEIFYVLMMAFFFKFRFILCKYMNVLSSSVCVCLFVYHLCVVPSTKSKEGWIL